MSNDRALGEHLGYLAYHIDALREREDNLESDLASARADADTDLERVKAERAVLGKFREDVTRRLAKLDAQMEKSLEDAPETAHERATEIRTSAGHAHLTDEEEQQGAAFQTASDLRGEE